LGGRVGLTRLGAPMSAPKTPPKPVVFGGKKILGGGGGGE